MIHHSSRRGVTLIELILVIGGLLFLAALLLPLFASLRIAASQTGSQNNLRQLGLACHNYHDSFNHWPPAVGKANNADGPAHFHLLPFLEQDNVFRTAGGTSWKKGTYSNVLPVFLDLADKTAPPGNRFQGWLATTNYAANWLVFRTGDKRIQDITDGTSNTLLLATRLQMCNGNPTGWGYPSLYTWAPIFAYETTAKFQINPQDDVCDPTVPQSIGPAMTVGFCDGSVRNIASGASPRTWHLLCDPADGNPIENDF